MAEKDVLEAITQLTAVIQEKTKTGADPKTELKWDDVKKDFEGHINELVAAQVQAKMDAAPVRPGASGEPIYGMDWRNTVKSNKRYGKMLHAFERHGEYRDGATKLKPADLAMALVLMEGQLKQWSPNSGEEKIEPSADLKAAIKAMDSTTANAGDEYVPTLLAPQLWDDFFLASRVVGVLQQINMPSNPFDVPLGLGSVTWRKGAENTAVGSSNPRTDKVTLTATELVTQQDWSYTLDEDAIVTMAPIIRARLAQSGAEAMDAFALNADNTASATGNINSDDGTPPSDSYYLSLGQDGIRHAYLVDNTTPLGSDENGVLEDATIVAEMKAMGKYAVDPTKLVIICDAQTYLGGFLNAATGSPGANLITVDKYGPNALVLTGQVASYRGIPIVVSASMPLTEADGKASVTAASNTKGQLAIVNRDMWYVGFRRNLLIEMDKDIMKRQMILVSSFREAIGAWGTRSSQLHTGGIFNIT